VSCEHEWENWGKQGGGLTSTGRERWFWRCPHCGEGRHSSRKPHTRRRGGDGVNWAMHRAYYIDLLKKGWPLKAAYDEAVRYTVEQEALSVTREVTA